MLNNALRFIRRTIYQMKRRQGKPMDVYVPSSVGTIDLDTGVLTRTYTKYHVRRGILLPQDIKPKFVQDLAYIAANRNFTEGGIFDRAERWFLFDKRDLPVELNDTNSYIVVGETRYNMIDITLMEDSATYAIKTRGVIGEIPYRQIDGIVRDRLTITETANAV